MTIKLPKNAPKNSAELYNHGGFDDELYIIARVIDHDDKVTVRIDNDCPLITTVKGWDEASGGLRAVMSRADAIQNLQGNIHQLTGNAIVYIKMPDHSVKIWTTERDGPPVWAGYSTGAGGIIGAEGPSVTSAKEMSEEVGIVIKSNEGHMELLYPCGPWEQNKLKAIREKGRQIPTVKTKLGFEGAMGVRAIDVQELCQTPAHRFVETLCQGNLVENFHAHVLREADHFDKPENIGNTISFQRYFLIDLSDQGFKNDDIMFVNPDPFDSPAVPATFEELMARHVTPDGRIVKAFPPIASILHSDNRGWAHPDQMLKQAIT